MARDFADKSAARQWVWDRLLADGVARFPFPPHGRIPNFAGADLAAARLLDIEPWKSATAIKVNPGSPQRPLRAEALRRGITVFVPTPRLRGGFKKLDPRRIPPDKIQEAAGLSRGDRWSEEVALADMPRLDAIVCGSVAVTRDGRRCGKGEGYSDLEFAILRELGHPPVPVATTVHDLQVVDSVPRDPTDQPLSVIVTPTHAIRIKRPSAAPTGIVSSPSAATTGAVVSFSSSNSSLDSSAKLLTKLSGFLISWAIPAVSWPSAAIFWACNRLACAACNSCSAFSAVSRAARISASARLRSVMSPMINTKPPPGTALCRTSMTRPSGRVRSRRNSWSVGFSKAVLCSAPCY